MELAFPAPLRETSLAPDAVPDLIGHSCFHVSRPIKSPTPEVWSGLPFRKTNRMGIRCGAVAPHAIKAFGHDRPPVSFFLSFIPPRLFSLCPYAPLRVFSSPSPRLRARYRGTNNETRPPHPYPLPRPRVPVLIDISSAVRPIVSFVSIIDTFVLRRYGPNVIFADTPRPYTVGDLICRVITERYTCPEQITGFFPGDYPPTGRPDQRRNKGENRAAIRSSPLDRCALSRPDPTIRSTETRTFSRGDER